MKPTRIQSYLHKTAATAKIRCIISSNKRLSDESALQNGQRRHEKCTAIKPQKPAKRGFFTPFYATASYADPCGDFAKASHETVAQSMRPQSRKGLQNEFFRICYTMKQNACLMGAFCEAVNNARHTKCAAATAVKVLLCKTSCVYYTISCKFCQPLQESIFHYRFTSKSLFCRIFKVILSKKQKKTPRNDMHPQS